MRYVSWNKITPSIDKRMSQTVDFSPQQRKGLLDILHTWKLKIFPVSAKKSKFIWYVEFWDKKLFVKKTIPANGNNDIDRYERPDLLLKYKKLLHNEVFAIQKERWESKNFYKVRFPDVVAVDDQYLVTEALSWERDFLLEYESLINFLFVFIFTFYRSDKNTLTLPDSLPLDDFLHRCNRYYEERKYIIRLNQSVDEYFFERGRYKDRYVSMEPVMQKISFQKMNNWLMKIYLQKLWYILYNPNNKQIVSLSSKLKNLMLWINQFKRDHALSFHRLSEKVSKRTGKMNPHLEYNWRFVVQDKAGKSYKISDDIYSFFNSVMFWWWTENRKPIFVVSDDLWLRKNI